MVRLPRRSLQVDVAGNLPVVTFSAAALRQVVSVLVANSVEHGEGTVSLAATVVESAIVIEVHDEGRGIKSDIEVAFSRRADRDSSRGIGLALARSLAEAEGGTLVYLAEPPRFLVTIPAEYPVMRKVNG